MNYAEMERKKLSLRKAMTEEEKRHTQSIQVLRQQFEATERDMQIGTAGLDLGLIETAKLVITVKGSYAKAGDDRQRVVAEVIQMLAERRPAFVEYYQGTKDYDRWHGQHFQCFYGYVPKHGSAIFTVGLTNQARTRWSDQPLTDDEISAAIYYLRNIEAIQQAEANAAAAALSAA